ncbi:serine/threonine-protein kinase 32A-like [Aplysia californica]|uniref:Serine/threonine-protein kinase 32A-like n=1 Tax=Aplysia californica TaxID=6500 RepID=A0ABM0JYB9_APLCA|nr:serine/threonine-protein kinase 32A-like [Aplysia californica]
MSSEQLMEFTCLIKMEKENDVFNYYHIHHVSILHQGQRSKVLMGVSNITPDKKFAIKLMPLHHAKDTNRFAHELRMMNHLADIPGVVPLLTPFISGHTGYLVMPYYGKGDLLSQIGNFNDYSWFKVLVNTAVSLQSLHKKRIYHQAMMPENILLTRSNNPYISDFGAARKLSEGCDKVDTWTAPSGFRGPEADREEGGEFCPFQMDTYSLAVSMWQALSGLCPAIYHPLDHLEYIPPQYAHFLMYLLLPDPDKRWTLAKFLNEVLVLHPELF